MKRFRLCGWLPLFLALAATGSLAAEDPSITSLQEEVRLLRARLDVLERKLAEASTNLPLASPTAMAPPAAPAAPPATLPLLVPELSSSGLSIGRAGGAYMNMSFDVLANAGWASTPDVKSIQPGGHDPSQRGVSLRNAEIALDGAVDPYFKGFANIVMFTEPDESTGIELEEAYVLTTSLPEDLQLKAGRFFAEFGRMNSQHPHTWAFADMPLVLNRMFGEDGLRQNGARISWLVPTPNYTEVMLGVFNGQGSDAFSFRYPGEPDALGIPRFYGRATTNRALNALGDLLFVPRLTSSFDLTEEQTLVLGASAAIGPNDTSDHARTLIYGADAFWKWKPVDAEGGWPFVTWQTEVLGRNFQTGADPVAALPAENLHDWGYYSQVQWGFEPRWVLGLRGEYVAGDHSASADANEERLTERRVSTDITFFPTEFSKLRLQYNHTWRESLPDENAVWLQLEFMLGSHAAHKY